jgi:hypothetical protein
VVEGSILLHQEHDVLDVGDGSGAVVGLDGQGARDTRRQRSSYGRDAHQFQKCAAIGLSHDNCLLWWCLFGNDRDTTKRISSKCVGSLIIE